MAGTVAADSMAGWEADSTAEWEADSTAEWAEGSAVVALAAAGSAAVVALVAADFGAADSDFATADFGGGIDFSSALGSQVIGGRAMVGVTVTVIHTILAATPTLTATTPTLYGGYPYGSYPYSTYPNYDTEYANSGGQPASCPQANGAPLYQIKLTYQNNIYLAQKYWYTPGTLNFITAQGEEKNTPINTIDPVTFQLNQSCGLNFT